jgi:hypothetical protein
MDKGQKLGLCCPLSCQNTGWSFPDKAYTRNIVFLPANDYLDMMANLRQRILATPEQVSELKT